MIFGRPPRYSSGNSGQRRTPARATVVVAVALLLSSTGSGVLLETKAVSLKSVVRAALTDTIKVDVVSGRLRRSSQSPTHRAVAERAVTRG